jgi:outer membrane protein assembly complex protein YaeT
MRLLAAGLLIALALLFGACQENGTVRVRSLTFRGVRSVDESRLRAAIATRVNSRLPWGRSAIFDRARFTADTQRLQAFYADRGFPDARVASVDVRLNGRQDAVDLVVTIEEGEPVSVAAITFDGFDVLPPDRLAAVKDAIPVSVGGPRDRRAVLAAQETALNELREHGFAYARVTTQEEAGPGGKATRIAFRAEPGPLTHFGPIEIAGNQSVKGGVIQRQLAFKPGDLYRRSVVQASQRRLYTMQLFQFVNIEMLRTEKQEPTLSTRVTVAEGRHQRVNFGVGYGTEEKARADGQYRHVNFLGGAREAGVHARWSSLDRGVRLDFNQPYFLASNLWLGGEAQQWWTYTPIYRSVVTGGKATLTRRLSTRMSWTVSLIAEQTSSTIDLDQLPDQTRRDELRDDLIALGLDPTTNRQEGTLNALAFDYQRSTADNPLNARTGYQLAFHVEEAGRLLPGSFNYYAASADARHYQPVSDRLVWANRLQLGGVWPIADRPGNVPFNKKYFLGGASSIRGWGRFEVGPLSEGFPVGGNALLAFTSEVRATVSNRLGGVLFLDGGDVWPDTRDVRLRDLRYAGGVGLRYQTPVGPLRFDLGYQLNRLPGLRVEGRPEGRPWRMHFSIGQAF